MKRTFFVSMLLILTVFWGCSSSTPVSSQSNATLHTLKRGDSFTYHYISYDTTGAAVGGSDSTVVSMVVETGQVYGGFSNVVVLKRNFDSLRVAQIANEGIAQYQVSKSVFPWAVVPGGWIGIDTTTKNRVYFDSVMHGIVSGEQATVHITVEANYTGDSTVVVGGTAGIKVHKFVRIVDVVVSIPAYSVSSTTEVRVTSNYAPSIGYYSSVSDVDRSDSPLSPVPNYTNDQELLSYTE